MNNEDELTRCKNDILYFIEKYVRVKTDDGNVPLHLTESQKKYLRKRHINSTYGENREYIIKNRKCTK